MTSNNYKIAIDLLKSRFGSTNRVIRAHIRALLSLNKPNIKSACSLNSFVGSVKRHMRGLESLSVASDNYEIFLCEILLSVVQQVIKQEWAKLDENKMNLHELLRIVEGEARHQEILDTTKTDINSQTNVTQLAPFPKRASINKSFAIVESCKCIFCSSNEHFLFNCPQFLQKSISDRFNFIKLKNVCINCLRNHTVTNCQSHSRCKICNNKHNTLLHFNKNQSERLGNSNQYTNQNTTNNSQSIPLHNASNINKTRTYFSDLKQSSYSQETALPTITIPIKHKTTTIEIGALLDSGSDRSFISAEIINAIPHTKINTEHLKINSFGEKNITETCPLVSLEVNLDENTAAQPIIFLVTSRINNIHNKQLKGTVLNTFTPDFPLCKQPNEIHIIVGADNFYKFATGNTTHINKELKLIETCFGWTCHGAFLHKTSSCDINALFTSCLSVNDSLDVKLFWDNQLAGILPNEELDSSNKILSTFKENIQFHNKRYTIKFPWLSNANISNNFKSQALSRLQYTTKKLVSTKMMEKYDVIMEDYLDKSIIDNCTHIQTDCSRYVPHHPVVRSQAESTKLRIVFDASAKGQHDISINDCLYEGPNLFPKSYRYFK